MVINITLTLADGILATLAMLMEGVIKIPLVTVAAAVLVLVAVAMVATRERSSIQLS